MKQKYRLSWVCITIASMAIPSIVMSAEGEASFTTGLATQKIETLIDCGDGSRASGVGTIQANDGSTWTVPADTHFTTATKSADLYNDCGNVRLSHSSEIDINAIPAIEAGGSEEFVAYIFADNYFEFYVNGQLLAVDSVPFTPFNSSVVRFKAERPLTLGVMMVDWEENLGLGSEGNRGTQYHPGDGGLVAHIKTLQGETVAITDDSWQAQTFYTSPLNSKECLIIDGNVRDSNACLDQGVADGSKFMGAHWAIPDNWMATDYQADWPHAVTFTNDTVGVNNKKAYTNFVDIFDDEKADAQFIWSSNLVLDNIVLLRKKIE